ncbi:MAG TPA: hypothetical protein VFS00_19305, partial [Polyangiaceae bacterium]|nr:hypothetical protein [Polyangiaceae bacterium]
GDFVLDDVSRQALRRACPAPPTAFHIEDVYGSSNALVCGRAWGLSAEQIMKSLGPECPDQYPLTDPCAEARRLLAVEPPIRLRP